MNDPQLKIRASIVDEATFLDVYGSIYEHSPWVAEGAYAARHGNPVDTAESLARAMAAVVAAAPEGDQLRLICAHPDLAGKLGIAETLTEASKSEQAGAGLDRCTAEEFEEFQSLNSAYKEKFGFPFIIAVKGHDRLSILAAFRARIHNDRPKEFKTALAEIDRIGLFRLMDLTE